MTTKELLDQIVMHGKVIGFFIGIGQGVVVLLFAWLRSDIKALFRGQADHNERIAVVETTCDIQHGRRKDDI